MNALARKEFRELAPLGALLAGASALAWGSLAKLGDYLGRTGDGFVLMAMAGVLAGVILGMAPFELERMRGTRAYLLHRATTARWVAVSRIAAAGAWAAIVLAVSFLAGPVAHLGPAYRVEGFVGGILSGLALAAGMVLPALGLGALAGTLVGGRMLRWSFALGGVLALTVWGERLTTEPVQGSPAGPAPYVAFLLLSASALSFVAIERFDRWARGTFLLRQGTYVTESSLTLAIFVLPWLLFASALQSHARQSALVENENWTVTPDRVLRRRPAQRWDMFGQLSNSRSYRLEPDERILLDCVYGGDSAETQPLGRLSRAWNSSGWMLGRQQTGHQPVVDGLHGVWFDLGLHRIMAAHSNGEEGTELFALGPANGAPRFSSPPEIVPLKYSDVGSGEPAFLVADPDAHKISTISLQDAVPVLAAIALPEEDEFVDLNLADQVHFVHEGKAETRTLEWVVVGRRGEYAVRSEDLVRVESIDSTPGSEPSPFSVRISERDGLGFVATLVDEERNEFVGQSEHAPRTEHERFAAFVAVGATLLRSPLGSVASHLLVSDAPHGAVAPAMSLWIDPLVLGGRRSWLMVLHLGFGTGLACLARRRLGGRGWSWPLTVFLLGLAAWLICRLVERRRAPTPESARPAPRPGWAPIVDRATA